MQALIFLLREVINAILETTCAQHIICQVYSTCLENGNLSRQNKATAVMLMLPYLEVCCTEHNRVYL